MKIPQRFACLAAIFMLACSSLVEAEDPATNAVLTARERNLAAVQKSYAANARKHGSNADMLVRPGLLANRDEKWVRIDAEATGVKSNYQCEFFLIATNSGKDYESLAVSLAIPSDVKEGLVFIGMQPGRPVDPNKCCFWPKGERVIATVEWDMGGEPTKARAESLMVNRKLGGTLPKEGFVFVGSIMRDAPNDPAGGKVLAADFFGPNAIATYYNDAETVMDVPRTANQGEMYSLQYPNPAYSFATGQMVSVTFEPEYKDGRKRVVDLVLQIASPARGAAAVSNVVAKLTQTDGAVIVADGLMKDVLTAFEKLAKDGRDTFVRVDFDGALPLDAIHDTCKFLNAIDTEGGIRMEPPSRGHPFYRAFTPLEKLRDRQSRSIQPWELRVTGGEGKLKGKLTLIEDVVNKDTGEWSTATEHFDASTPDDARKALNLKREDGRLRGPSAVFVFAPRSMRYGALQPLIAACLETRPFIHIYTE